MIDVMNVLAQVSKSKVCNSKEVYRPNIVGLTQVLIHSLLTMTLHSFGKYTSCNQQWFENQIGLAPDTLSSLTFICYSKGRFTSSWTLNF